VLLDGCRVLARTDNRDAARRGGVLDREALDQEELPIESKVVRLTRPDA
jgi:hypothetical protein